MNRLVVLALLAPLGACGKQSSDGYPVNPGGGGGVGSEFTPDAPVGDDGGTSINGRVCMVAPPSVITCAATGAGNLTVTLGTATTTTADDGSFTLTRPAITTGLVWRVSGTAIRAAAMKYSTATTIPAIDEDSYLTMLTATNATVGSNSGAVIARITRGGFAVAGAVVASQQADGQIYYDGPSITEWGLDATGAYGVAWVPSMLAGSATLTVTKDATQTMFAAQPVYADTVTFVLAEIP